MSENRRVLVCVLMSAVFASSCRSPSSEAVLPLPRVRCVSAQARSLADEIVLRGTVVPAPDRSATLSSQVPGRIVRLAVREGDDVEAGQLIAEVEPQPARDTLEEAQAMLEEAIANRNSARTEAAHEEALVEKGIASRRSLESLRAAQARAEAAVSAASAQVHAARKSLARTAVRAPIAGAIVHLQRRKGELVDGTPATPICDVVDMSALELAATAAPSDLVHVRPGQPARVRFQGLEGVEFAASVRTVGRSVGANGMGQVWLSLDPGRLQPPLGLLGTASIAVSEPRDVVTTPAVAVRSAGGDRLEVVVCDGGVARVREVQIGRREASWVEVTSGLASGERVAVDEVTALEDGAPIDVAETP